MLFIPEFPWSDLHTLNLDWLLSVVAMLKRQVDDLGAVSTPSESDPLMDGTASPGVENEFARGDHRHPTDTTRASVADLQALQDRVPGPSNGLPKMDGDAYSGFYDNYSRADHVHPSDTSKLDKTGGEVNGLLDIVPRRCSALLSSPGWYRVMKIVGGTGAWSFAVDLCVTQAYNTSNNEVHAIKLLQTYNAAPSFEDEVSKTNALNVAAIRYTVDGNGVGYVDVRYDGNSGNTVAVDFNVHADPTQQVTFTPEHLIAVPASPSGETVLTEYSFIANTTVPSNSYVPTISFIDGSSINVSEVSTRYEMRDRLLLLSGRFKINSMSEPSNTVLTISFPPNIIIPGNEPDFVGFCTNMTKTLGVRCNGSLLYLTDPTGGYSKPQLTTGSYLFSITAFV